VKRASIVASISEGSETLVRIKVEYDKYNRTFKLLDRDFGSVLEDGAQYELLVPLMLDVEIENDEEEIVSNNAPLAHA
jgi:hypothetical protein